MPEISYQRRGPRTLTVLLALRTMPALIFLLILLVVVSLKSQIILAFGIQSDQAMNLYNLVLQSGFSIFLVVIGVSVLLALIDYYSFAFSMDDEAFNIREGILNINEMSILYRQIQNVDIDRPLVYRLFNMSKLVILTSGVKDTDRESVEKHDDDAEGIIDLIDSDMAEKLHLELLDRAHVQVVREEPLPATDLHMH